MQPNPLPASRSPMQEPLRRAAKKRGVLLGLVGLMISSPAASITSPSSSAAGSWSAGSSRLGGEEFGLVLPATRQDEAYGLVDRLRADVAELDFSDLGLARAITLSGGVAPYTSGESYLEPWRRADQALYRAKDGGRNRVLVAASSDALPEADSPAAEDALVAPEPKL